MDIEPKQFEAARSMDELYRLLDAAGMGNGWAKPEPSMYPSPKSRFVPAQWRWELARPALDAAGRFVSTDLAERRNLICFNPIPGNTYASTGTLVAAYQMVLAGETARSHRHTPNALRLVLDTQPGAYTVVEGKKIPMAPGDVLLTPNWCWHGHSNESDAPAYWIDFLDVPLVHLLEPMFFEQHAERLQASSAVEDRSPMRFAFADTKIQLATQTQMRPGVSEVEIGPPRMETIGLKLLQLEPNHAYSRGRSTANSLFAIIQGSGRSVIDGAEFHWKRGDVIAVPAWLPQRHEAAEPSYLLKVTDEPLLRTLKWYREE